jgi:type VI protein secretion system component VasK
MNNLKRYLGIIWMLIAPVAIFILISSAITNIDVAGKGDINKPLPWIIIIAIFTPVAIGLMIFGWYAWKGDYDDSIV